MPATQIEVLPEPMFIDPPERDRAALASPLARMFEPAIAALQDHPGEWAMIARMPIAAGKQLKRGIELGKWGFHPAGAYQAKRIVVASDEARLWVLFTPPETDREEVELEDGDRPAGEPLITQRAAEAIADLADLDRELRTSPPAGDKPRNSIPADVTTDDDEASDLYLPKPVRACASTVMATEPHGSHHWTGEQGEYWCPGHRIADDDPPTDQPTAQTVNAVAAQAFQAANRPSRPQPTTTPAPPAKAARAPATPSSTATSTQRRADALKQLCQSPGCQHGAGRHDDQGCNRTGCACVGFTN